MLSKLLFIVDENCNNINENLIKKAYDMAYVAHKEQKRKSGEPYIIHPVEVACILAELGLDTATIAAGLLHDIIEDTEYTYKDISDIFGNEIADLVEGVTKLGEIEFKSKEEQQADNVRKMLLAMAKDIRVILIKLADRLHNMRTLKFMSVFKQKEKARETLDIYAPLAHRLGISKIKWELEDLSLRYLNPNQYYSLVKKIAEKRAEREENISKIVDSLQNSLASSGISAEIEGRPKHFYSIYNKMVKKNKTLDQIFDLTAIRILVNSISDCYAALGIVHTLYKPMPGRFKDYIAMPKPNMYQSLHSTVIGPQGKPFEIQIRTYEMHRTAEYGIAAHWKYKEGNISKEDDLDSKLSWLRDVLEWQYETSDAEEFMEAFKIDLFSDEVFVFTPKGKVINLPYNSTPIDFAYRIHTDVGHRCVGAKVNGKMVPLDYKLKTGQIVEIITSPTFKGPSIDWLSIVNSNHAKSKIKSWFKKLNKEENIVRGKELLEKESKKYGYYFSEFAKSKEMEKIFKKYAFKSMEDLYAAVGTGIVLASNIVIRLKDNYISDYEKNNNLLKQIESKAVSNNKARKKSNIYNAVSVKGSNNIMVRFAKCCNPVSGDDIIGYITKGRGVSVHRKDCKNINRLMETEGEKIIEVSWENIKGFDYVTEIQVKADDRNGLLTEVMNTIIQTKAIICSVSANTDKNNIASINIKLKINDVAHLKTVSKKIKKIKGVIDVFRLNS